MAETTRSLMDYAPPPVSGTAAEIRTQAARRPKQSMSLMDFMSDLDLANILSGTGIPERFAAANEVLNPLAAIPRAQAASQEIFAPDRSITQRIASTGDMLAEVGGVVVPMAASARAGAPAAAAVMEGLLGGSPTTQAASDAARGFLADESGSLPLPFKADESKVLVENAGDYDIYRYVVDGKTVGELWKEPSLDTVEHVSVLPEFRRSGIGTALYDAAGVKSPSSVLSDDAKAFWQRRLSTQPTRTDPATQRNAQARGFLADESGSLPLPFKADDPAQARGAQIIDMLTAGRAGEITDEMLDLGDPVANARLNEYLYRNYDLPMDEASRMQRAIQGGFDVNDEMYRGDAPLQSFNTGRGQREQIGVTGSSVPDVAASYIPARGEGGIYPLVSRGQNDAVISARGQNWNVISPNTEVQFQGERSRLDEYIPVDQYFEPYDVKAGTAFFDTDDLSRIFQGYGADRVRFNDLVDRGASAKYYGPQSSLPSDVTMVANPVNVRSRFARFDPRLAHLRNLSAGIIPLGLLAMPSNEEQY